MRSIPTGFGCEKLCFLSAAVALSGAAYYLLTSAPLQLRPPAPVSCSEAFSVRAPEQVLSVRSAEESYVFGGMDPESGVWMNRERMYPFEPYANAVTDAKLHAHADVLPSPKDATVEAPKAKPREFAPVALASAVEYRGVLSANGSSVGLLNRKDGSGYLSVKEGTEFTVSGEKYRVDRLEKQAICVSCGGVCVVLKNFWFGGEMPARGQSRGDSRSF